MEAVQSFEILPMESFRLAVFDTKEYDQAFLIEACKEDPRIDVHFFEPKMNLNNVQLAHGFDGVCVFVNDELDCDVVAALEEMGVGLIALRCAGFDRVDMMACNAAGLSVVRVPAYSPHGVAEFGVALLLTLNRKIHLAYNRIRDGNFSISGLVGSNLQGKTVGVCGTGKIGKCFIDIMIGFGCIVKAFDPYPNPELAENPKCEYVSLEDLMRTSDIISLHMPLTPESRHIINSNTIAHMKRGVVILNTSRGPLIDSHALIRAIKSGQVGGAGLDVYEEEDEYFFEDRSFLELQDDALARLSNMRNVIMTSHQAFLTNEALTAIAEVTVGNIQEYIEGKRLMDLTNAVDAPGRITRRKSSLIAEKAKQRRAADWYSRGASNASMSPMNINMGS